MMQSYPGSRRSFLSGQSAVTLRSLTTEETGDDRGSLNRTMHGGKTAKEVSSWPKNAPDPNLI